MQKSQELTNLQPHSLAFQIFKTSAIAAFSACIAETATIPMDTIKVRLQMQNTAGLTLPKASEEIREEIKHGVTIDRNNQEAREINADAVKSKVEKLQANAPKYRGLVGTGRTIVAEEGGLALFKGLTAGI